MVIHFVFVNKVTARIVTFFEIVSIGGRDRESVPQSPTPTTPGKETKDVGVVAGTTVHPVVGSGGGGKTHSLLSKTINSEPNPNPENFKRSSIVISRPVAQSLADLFCLEISQATCDR
ncbi:hypothetical protein GWI33_004329 [Rhynchophorus ferrugineus]|uniref:Uncharacterized protein n=1 Tax=Rhynchophorus ferrugineus TaxID=354439 RepID=A0A834IZ78_RHYFE|nr:hypothetical protein GWI33_004329 [Rhynchophorus ferrugineus]